MKAYLAAAAAVSLLLSTGSAFAQSKATADNAPDLAYEAVPNFFQTPVGDYMGGLPRDAEFEVRNQTPFMCGARMENFKIDLTGAARLVD